MFTARIVLIVLAASLLATSSAEAQVPADLRAAIRSREQNERWGDGGWC